MIGRCDPRKLRASWSHHGMWLEDRGEIRRRLLQQRSMERVDSGQLACVDRCGKGSRGKHVGR